MNNPEKKWKLIAALITAAAVAALVLLLLPRQSGPVPAERFWGEGSVSAALSEPEGEESASADVTEPAPDEAAQSASTAGTEPEADALSLWTENAPLKRELTAYLDAISRENSPDYIPPERRAAVFDLDGTLFCETDPCYLSYSLLVHRALEDEGYKASEFERETARKIVTWNETGKKAKGLAQDHARALASAFGGVTLEEYDEYVRAFLERSTPGYTGMRRGDAWYQPMLQVVTLLKQRGFSVWVVTGTNRFLVRALVEGSPLDLPPDHILGSDDSLTASGQDDTPGTDYVLDEDDSLILEGALLRRNNKMNKVTAIVREIGVQPVLAFGNSEGDVSMARYVTRGNSYRTLAAMLCCDDTRRENGDGDKAAEMAALCAREGWIPVSMRDDWTTIYGADVTKK